MDIGIVGATGWMGAWHARMLERAAKELDVPVQFSLFSRNSHATSPVQRAKMYSDMRSFCGNTYNLLVMAVHPEHRLVFYEAFGPRLAGTYIFLEKPLSATHVSAETTQALLTFERTFASRTIVNYPELYDPLTEELYALLAGQRGSVPALEIREVQCNRSKDREHVLLAGNERQTESLIIQEGVHDLSFVLQVLFHCRGLQTYSALELLAAHATDLRHPSGSLVPLAGSSYTLFTEPISGTSISIVNSFIDPYTRKEKVLVCIGADGQNYTVVANYQPQSRRSLKVYMQDGVVIYDADLNSVGTYAVNVAKEEWNLRFMKQLLSNVASGQGMSNFVLADLCEAYARSALDMQKVNRIHPVTKHV